MTEILPRASCLAALLLLQTATSVFAQVGEAPASPIRYPWDSRPNRCLILAEAATSAECRLIDWPTFVESKQRMDILFANLDYRQIDRAANHLGRSDRRFGTGEYEFEALYLSMQAFFRYAGDWGPEVATGWAATAKNSGFDCVARAMTSWAGAWSARGSGNSNTVSPEAWSLYYAGLAEAHAKLQSCPEDIRRSGPWHIFNLQLVYESPALKPSRLDALGASSEKWPVSTLLYGVPMRFAEPRWGGSFSQMDAIALLANQRTSQVLGEGMYALVYESALRGNSTYTVRDTAADWEKLKRGFRDVEAKAYGAPWIWRNFASLACQARDKGEAKRLLQLYDQRRDQSVAITSDGCRLFAFSE